VEGAFAIPDFKYGLRNTFATGSSNCGPAKYAGESDYWDAATFIRQVGLLPSQ